MLNRLLRAHSNSNTLPGLQETLNQKCKFLQTLVPNCWVRKASHSCERCLCCSDSRSVRCQEGRAPFVLVHTNRCRRVHNLLGLQLFFVYPFSIISVFVVYSFAVLLFLCLGVLLCCMGGALRRLFVVNVCLYLGLIDRTE